MESLKRVWKSTDYRIYDPKDTTDQLVSSDIVLTELTLKNDYGTLSKFICLVKVENLKRFTKNKTFGVLNNTGFNDKYSKSTTKLFIDQLLGSLDNIITTVEENKLSKFAKGFNIEICNSLLPRSKVLKEKTLIILDDKIDNISTKELERSGIKYKEMSTRKYKEMIESEADMSDYCLFYFDLKTVTDVSIFDLEDNSLIFSRHYSFSKGSFSAKDIKLMVSSWE
jgi:hypothetical protein